MSATAQPVELFPVPDNPHARQLCNRQTRRKLLAEARKIFGAPVVEVLTAGGITGSDPIGTDTVPIVGTLLEIDDDVGRIALPEPVLLDPFTARPTATGGRSGKYADAFRSVATRKSWRSSWETALILCLSWDFWPLPMEGEHLAEIVAHLADIGFAYGSIRNMANAVRAAHVLNDLPSPTQHAYFLKTIQGIARTIGIDPIFRKDAFLISDVRAAIAIARERPGLNHALQEAVILVLGYFFARRRSEFVSLDYPRSIRIVNGKIEYFLDKSKTNQLGVPEKYTIDGKPGDDICPVTWLRNWIARLPEHGPLLRTIDRSDNILDSRICDRTIARTVKRYAGLLGYDPDDFGAHSLRAGFVTDSLLAGISESEIVTRTGQFSFETLGTYFRPRDGTTNITRRLIDATAHA